MIRTLGTIFAGLLGLAFGSFLNVCLSRWPRGESIVQPRSHCEQCGRTLSWRENVPLVSWLLLGGRCRTCHIWIGWRTPLVELAVALLWAAAAWHFLPLAFAPDAAAMDLYSGLAKTTGMMIFYWLLVALAVLDAENLWLPNRLTLPGAVLGFVFTLLLAATGPSKAILPAAGRAVLAMLCAAGLILLIRWIYWLIRHREGIGLGDAKLMALLAAWLGLPGALLAFSLGVALGALAAIFLLLPCANRANAKAWANRQLPLGTFLCIGGLISSFWGTPLIAAYLHWAGF